MTVLAHEVGPLQEAAHPHRHRDLGAGSGSVPGPLLPLRRAAGLFDAFGVDSPSVYAGVIFVSILLRPLSLILSVGGAALSRRHERQADRFAVATTGRGDLLASGLKRLSKDNLTNLTPHPFYVFLEYSHPPTLERVRRWKPAPADEIDRRDCRSRGTRGWRVTIVPAGTLRRRLRRRTDRSEGMRIALIGQAAFGEKVLEALVDAGEEVAVVYMPPDPAGGRANPFRESAAVQWHPRASAGTHARRRGVRRVQDLRRRSERHGFRHRHRAPDHPGASASGDHPVSPVASTAPPWGQCHQLGRDQRGGRRPVFPSSGRTKDSTPDPSCSRKKWSSSRTIPSVRLLRQALPAGDRGSARVGASGQGGHGSQDRPGPDPGRVRARLQAHGHRLDVSGRRGLQRHPRLQPVAGRGHVVQRPGVEGVRLREVVAERSRGSGHHPGDRRRWDPAWLRAAAVCP